VSCVDELLVSITAVRRIYRLAVRAPGRRLLCRLLVFIFSGPSDRGRVGCKASGRRAALECTVPQNDAYIRAASAPRRRVLQKPAPLKCRRRRLLAGPRRLVPHYLLPKTRGCAGFGPKGLPLAQGPAAGRAGASRRETPATAAHRPFAALPKNARLGASAFTRGSPISTTPSFERQASSEGARPRCDSAQRAAFAVPAAPQRCCACYF
jgi:hypothetical protein